MEVSSIRAASRADVPRLVVLEAQAFPGDRLSERSFRTFIGRSTASMLVAVGDADVLLGYTLVLFRQQSPVARLYSIAVAAEARGLGLAKRLMDAAERDAAERGALAMRLEVRADNTPAIGLYERLGYRSIGRIADYYEDHSDALRFEKVLARAAAPARFDSVSVPYWPQTTEFTCGAATLMMVLAAHHRVPAMSEELELTLWREATCIYLISAPGGCDPYGLAVAAHARGLAPTVHVSMPGPYFVEVTRGAAPKQIMSTAQADYVRQANDLGIATEPALSMPALCAALDRGALVIVLISPYRFGHGVVPHWVLAFARDGDRVLVHDPYLPPATPPNDAGVAVELHELERMSVWGRSRLRAAIVLEEPPQR